MQPGEHARGALAEDDRDNLLALIARLYYVENRNQNEIAALVGVSRSQISRLLDQARERGIVRVSVAPYDPRSAELEAELAARFRLGRAIVIRTLRGAGAAQVRYTIGSFAAPVVSDWIRPGSVVGLAGGRTVAEVVARLGAPSMVRGSITAVQLMGNIGPDVTAIDAIELSRTMAACYGGSHYALSAPAFVPDSSTRDAFLQLEHMRSIWRLFKVMDTAFVGIGTLRDSAFIARGVLQEGDLDRLRRAGAVGEICGRFYDENGHECVSDYAGRVISITFDELRAVPEVVGITHGSDRRAAVDAALRGGLLKSLVIDEAGARALLRAG